MLVVALLFAFLLALSVGCAPQKTVRATVQSHTPTPWKENKIKTPDSAIMALQLPTPTSTQSSTKTSTSALVTSPVLNFQTPVLTTSFTPPPSCTQGHITMLMSAAYQIWLNEPRPVPNTTISDCYPPQFMTSFLASVSSTILPAFSPLVCPDNYFTIYNQTITSRPLYVACCPR